MKVKRFLLKVLKGVLTLLLILLVIGVGTNIIYDNIASDEISLQEGYEIKKEKCELLRTIAGDVIEEGKGINTQGITNKDIKYKIYNDGDNIIFYYYIVEQYSSEINYNARITLSNDYKILDEEYGVELEDYETYKHAMQFLEILISAMLALLIVVIVYGISMGAYFVMRWWMRCRRNKK